MDNENESAKCEKGSDLDSKNEIRKESEEHNSTISDDSFEDCQDEFDEENENHAHYQSDHLNERLENVTFGIDEHKTDSPHPNEPQPDRGIAACNETPTIEPVQDVCDNTVVRLCTFMCSACSYNDRVVQATVTCSECLEFYCHECSVTHKALKATRSHLVQQHDDLPNKTTCESCAYNGDDTKYPTHFCIDCDEAQCIDCASSHKNLKSTRSHILIPSPGTESKSQSRPQVIPPSVDTVQERKPKETRQPGKPVIFSNASIDCICLVWTPPEVVFQDFRYQLRYKEINSSSKWEFCQEMITCPSVKLQNLKSGTKFVFQVRVISDENEGPYSELSDPVETAVFAAEQLLYFMYDVKIPSADMPLKKVPLQENIKARNETGKTRKLCLGAVRDICSKERTILLIGATGTGKSTLVDGMINYIFGVKWDDPYRLTLVDLEDEERTRDVDQAVSQTQWITCYSINPLKGGRLDYKLNIIDTPGFGDTRGIDRDKQIVQQIQHLFSRDDEAGILYIDAVCFIIKAPDARLTPTQMYIFNAIMSLFGQDIKNNFSMLITFADGKQPPVLSALKKANLPHDDYFPFNNSGLFADNSHSDVSDFGALFWKMGYQSFEKFFAQLSKMETKSLRLTRDVLSHREQIELTMDNLLPLVDAGLLKVEETRIEINILEEHKAQIDANSDFKYIVTETQQKQIDLPKGRHVTNCLNCHFTCHNNCAYANDEDKAKCCAMRNGICTQCPDKCKWDIHRNTPYIFEYVSMEKVKTYAEKLKKYRQAKDEKMTREKVVQRMHDELCYLEQKIFEYLQKINECNNELRKIALRPDPLTLVEHIDILIESEQQEKRPGFLKRIASLKKCRRRANISDEIDHFGTGLEEAKSKLTPHVKVQRSKVKKRGKLFYFF